MRVCDSRDIAVRNMIYLAFDQYVLFVLRVCFFGDAHRMRVIRVIVCL